MHKLKLILCTLYLFITLGAQGVQAAKQRLGDYEVHYNAFSSNFLSPEMARLYDLPRSRNTGLINLTVIYNDGTNPTRHIAADVEINASNSLGALIPVTIRTITEADAVYLLGSFPIANRDTLRFQINVTDAGQPVGKLDFSQQFFTD